VMVALEFEGFPHSHFPPFWLQRQDPVPCKTTSSRRLTRNHTLTSLCTCHVGWLQLVFSPPDRPLSGKQSFWDRQGVLSDKVTVESNLSTEHGKASFLAASVPRAVETGWLLSLPITACGLRLERTMRYRPTHCSRLEAGSQSLCAACMPLWRPG